MASVNTTATLIRLSILHNRSLPMYLRYAEPWLNDKDEEAAAVIESIAESNDEYVDRFADLINEAGEQVPPGDFPIVYSGYHDLTVDFFNASLDPRADGRHPYHFEQCIEDLRTVPMARAVAEESLGAAKAHLDSLNGIDDCIGELS